MKYDFLKVCNDVTKAATKIPQCNYLIDGLYPIYDQGKDIIGGYTNTDNGIASDYPYILFGDHTRVIKYINNPCFIGADGVKLLKVINHDFLPKYVYYSMIANPVESQGYSRHFKFLKETTIKYVDIINQNKIIKELDNINNSIEIKNIKIKSYDELVKSRFIEMFGDLNSAPKYHGIKLREICKTLSGGTPTTKHPEYYEGNIPWITTVQLGPNYIDGSNPKAFITQEAIKNSATHLISANCILFGTRVGVGKSSINTEAMCTNQDINAITEIDLSKWNLLFIKKVLDNYLPYFDSIKKGATILGITTNSLKGVDIPDVDKSVQDEFASFVEKIDKSKFIVQKEIKDLQELLDTKMDEYFGQ